MCGTKLDQMLKTSKLESTIDVYTYMYIMTGCWKIICKLIL